MMRLPASNGYCTARVTMSAYEAPESVNSKTRGFANALVE
jgi:hypothetical protein